jgi:hypothetical protein
MISQWCSLLTIGCQDITMMLYFNLWMKCQDTSILNYAKFYNISLTGSWEYFFLKSLLVLLYTPTCTSQVFNVTFLFLSTLTIGVLHTSDFYMYIAPPPSFSFWNITGLLWSNTTHIIITDICVIFRRRTMSLSICSMVQLYIVQYSREWKYSTNVNCHWYVKNWRK